MSTRNKPVVDHLSFSSLKEFVECPAEWLAVHTGRWDRENSFGPTAHEALLVGGYVAAHFESEQAESEFFDKHADEMFSTRGAHKGELKSQYRIADTIIGRLENSDYEPLFQKIYQGKKEFPLEGNIGGVRFTGRADCVNDRLVNHKDGFIVDLKTVGQSLTKSEWDSVERRRVIWAEEQKYYWQLAIYRELYRQMTGNTYRPVIVAASKEAYPDVACIQFPENWLAAGLEEVEASLSEFELTNTGGPARRCEHCNYCKKTRYNDKFTTINDLIERV